ncbi:multidrug ABC transporter ATP-binding protein [Bacillus sp. AFS002410]|uniref:ABC transporter ATP-binding protein n=1 Tax=Bacillus sp. AFS002410 TaxID=2033481 RepID=UPI000BF06B30|nr:ABC transporter ATP-binding protein [Bacillus sp. AFS002410]PEJ57791.1 multidrug ABC transporter ATP-binding protein [Bacillus sp. AFS002410]
MWGLRSYIKPYWKSALIAPLFMIFEVFFDLLQPKYAADIVNLGLVKHDIHTIEQTGALMVLVAVLGLLAGVGCNYFAIRASQNFGADLRDGLFTKVQAFSFENLDSYKTGSLITRMTNDVVQVQNLLRIALQSLVRTPGLLIGSVIMAIWINSRLGLILMGTLFVLVVLLVILIRFSYPLFSNVQAKLDAVNSRLQENLAGIRVVKAFVRSDYETKQFKIANKDYSQSAIKAARVIAMNTPIVTFIMNMCLVGILLYGGNLVRMNSVQVGDLIAFINYVTQVLSSLLMVSTILVNISQSSVSAKRIQEVLTTRPTIENSLEQDHTSVSGNMIEFHQVGFSYGSSSNEDEAILKDVNFEAKQGETIAIIGSTGSGKTSLVQLIPRLYDVTAGSILMDGVNIQRLPLLELRKKIGMVLQESFLFTGSIRDNIAFGKSDATQEEIEEAATVAQAHDFISKLPDGYETKIGQRGVNLSGGQKQRISIARALLIKPPVLILDDSTSALDLNTEKRLRDSLSHLMNDSITFLIAQKISSVVNAEKILVMEDGAIVGSGTHQELMKTCVVYQEIYKSQYGEREVYNVQ